MLAPICPSEPSPPRKPKATNCPYVHSVQHPLLWPFPLPVSSLLHAATMIVAGALLLLRIAPILATCSSIATALYFLGCLTPLYSSLMAIGTYDAKRIVAYSTAAHIGLTVLSSSLLVPLCSVSHLLAHASSKALLFMSCGLYLHSFASVQDSRALTTLAPLTGLLLCLALLTLCGLPGTSIHSSKDTLLLSLWVACTCSASPLLSTSTQLVLLCSFLLSILYSAYLLRRLNGQLPLSSIALLPSLSSLAAYIAPLLLLAPTLVPLYAGILLPGLELMALTSSTAPLIAALYEVLPSILAYLLPLSSLLLCLFALYTMPHIQAPKLLVAASAQRGHYDLLYSSLLLAPSLYVATRGLLIGLDNGLLLLALHGPGYLTTASVRYLSSLLIRSILPATLCLLLLGLILLLLV